MSFGEMPFGCSTLSVKDGQGNWLFGRNFDWNSCNAIIVSDLPDNGYASISTVNTDFIRMSGLKLSDLPDAVQAMICLYAPLDGMNEKGLAVSVNMIQDTATISQNTDKPDITTTTAIRLLLNQAADVEEAVELLGQICQDSFEMFAEVSRTADMPEIHTKILAQMKTILEEKGLTFVQFYVRFVDEIQPDMQTGKKRQGNTDIERC